MDMFIARLDYAMTHLGWLGFLTAVYFAGIGMWLAQLIWRRSKAASWQERSETFEEYRLLWHRALDNQMELLEACEIHETSLLQQEAKIASLKQHCEELSEQRDVAISELNDVRNEIASYVQKQTEFDALRKYFVAIEKELEAVLASEHQAKMKLEQLEREASQEEQPVEGDDLTEIITLTRRMESRLNRAGVFRFDQIAAWTAKEQRHFEHLLQQDGCIRDGQWVQQAREIVQGQSATLLDDEQATMLSSKQTEYARAVRALQSVAIKIDDARGAVFVRRPCRVDDLTVIRGIGEINEKCLQDEGVYRLEQIAAWTPDNVQCFNERLSFKGRIEREQWVVQARRCIESQNRESHNASLRIATLINDASTEKTNDASLSARRAA